MEKTKNVLVCEDDPVQLKILTSVINLAGYRTLAALSPVEAMMKARQCGVDAVLTDVVLPDKSGFDLVDELRGMGCDAPVFMTSAHATEGMRARARKAGVKWFFEKPFGLRAIRERVEAALGTKKSEARVLLVESDPKGLSRLSKAVVGAGAAVLTAESGEKALEALTSGGDRVDVLLMDLDASGVSGAELIRKARSVVPSLYVVMMSDDAGREEIRAGYEAGAAALIRKSTSPERAESFMKSTLRMALADRRGREEGLKRAERLAAEPPGRKALRWVKSYLHAPSCSRKAARVATAAFMVLGMAVGAGSAAQLQFGLDQADRAEALSERLAERMLPFSDQRSAREERAMGRFQAQEQLGIMREANAVTRRYYEGHLEEMRRQALPRSQDSQGATLPGPAVPVFEFPRALGR